MPTRWFLPFLMCTHVTAWAAVVDFNEKDAEIVTPKSRAPSMLAPKGAKWEQKFNIAQVDLLVSTARHFFDEGNPEAALENLLRADSELPFNPFINLAISQTCASMGNYDRAILYGNRVITYAPRNPVGYLVLGFCYLEAENFPQAQNIYEALLDFDPQQTDALAGLAHALGSQGQYEKAVATYKKAITLQPNSAYLYEMLGNVEAARGERGEAIRAYKKALELDPKAVEVYNSLGAAEFAMGNTNKAVEVYNKAIQIAPKNAKLYRNYAGVLMAAGDDSGALQALMASLEIEFTSPHAWQHMLLAYRNVLRKDDPSWQLPSPPSALASKKEQAEWHHALGLTALNEGKIAQAGQHMIRAIQLNEKDPTYFNDFGTLVAAHLYKPYSIPFFQAAEIVDPGFLTARVNRTYVQSLLDAEKRAARFDELKELLTAQPGTAAQHFELGRLYAAQNQITHALPHFAQATAQEPENLEARLDYAQALYISGRPEDAIFQMEAAIRLIPNEPRLQYRLAWLLFQKQEGMDTARLQRILALLKSANQLSNYMDPNFLRTWAQAYALGGHYRDALEIVGMARDRADELGLQEMTNEISKELDQYQKKLSSTSRR